LLAGAVSGALILGLVARVATAGVALLAGLPANLSFRGMLESSVVGALLGVAGGFLLPVIGRALGRGGPLRGVVTGVVLFFCALLVAWARGRIQLDLSGPQPITLIVVFVAFLIYGIAADALLARLRSGRSNRA